MKIPRLSIFIFLIIFLIFSVGCQPVSTPAHTSSPSSPVNTVPSSSIASPIITTPKPASTTTSPPILTIPTNIITSPSPIQQLLKVSFIDVGQADCTIIQYGTTSMLIDAGGNATATALVSKIKNMGITKFDIVIGTHPHEDHIGGMDAVINNFNIGAIYMPKVSNTTKTFEDVLLAIQKKGLTITTPVPGATFTLGQDVQCTIFAPNSSSYPDLNSYSIVIKMVYGSSSFLFTGDAEADSEKEMLSKGYDIKADILKVGHHGSTSSTSPAFLKAVSPKYAVIFVGKDNTYGHPHQVTLDKLNAAGIKIYRTDLNGTITFSVTGSNISISTER